MKEIGTVGVLVYLVVATFAELYVATTVSIGLAYYAVIGVIAISEAVIMAAIYMRLREEPAAVRGIAGVGIFFIAVLIVALLFVYV